MSSTIGDHVHASPSTLGSLNQLNKPDFLNGSCFSAPVTPNSRWSKICDWSKAHKKELIILAGAISLVVGVASSGSFFVAIAVGASAKVCTALLFATIFLGPLLVANGFTTIKLTLENNFIFYCPNPKENAENT